MRVPCVVRWPEHVPAGTTCDEVTSTIDLLPTFARLAGGTVPQDRIIDGRDIWPLLSGEAGATSPHRAFYYYHMDQLQAVRAGCWKLYLPLEAKRTNLGSATAIGTAELYDLDQDIGEKENVAGAHPEVVQRLLEFAREAREDLGDGPNRGRHQRPVGRFDDPQPLR